MPRWTAEARDRQRQLIQEWKPWDASTGPKTIEGKSAVSMNRLLHGRFSRRYLESRRVAKVLRQTNKALAQAFRVRSHELPSRLRDLLQR